MDDDDAFSPEELRLQRVRRILWFALLSNAAMFGVELAAGIRAQSVSLLADAIDFLGDSGSYGLSLYVLTMALVWRARAALIKGVIMAIFGLWVITRLFQNLTAGVVPEPEVMGVVGVLALVTNLAVAFAVIGFREGDSNLRSVWLSSRNDALANVAILVAAFGVFGTSQGWPDHLVAAIIAALELSAAVQIVLHAREELRATPR